MRRSASPGAAAAFLRMEMQGDVRDVLTSVSAPTLIGHGPAQRDEARYVAGAITGAEIVEIAGLGDIFSWATLGRERRPPRADEALSRTDRHASRSGLGTRDGALHRHRRLDGEGRGVGRPALARAPRPPRSARPGELGRFGSREIKTMGDGFLAIFDGPARAIRSAVALGDSTQQLGISVRQGLHTGECELAASSLTDAKVG